MVPCRASLGEDGPIWHLAMRTGFPDTTDPDRRSFRTPQGPCGRTFRTAPGHVLPDATGAMRTDLPDSAGPGRRTFRTSQGQACGPYGRLEGSFVGLVCEGNLPIPASAASLSAPAILPTPFARRLPVNRSVPHGLFRCPAPGAQHPLPPRGGVVRSQAEETCHTVT
jgi:hypothetical protein